MGKRKKKSPKISIATIIVALILIIGSKFAGSDIAQKHDEPSKNNTQYESRVDKNDENRQKESKVHKNSSKKKEEKNYTNNKSDKNIIDAVSSKSDKNKETADANLNKSFDYNRDVPVFSGQPSVEVNNDTPYFPKPKSTSVYKKYSDLDSLNRVGVCEVLTGPEYLPKEKRGDISHVKPTGWKQKKYDFVDGKHLYNRCHLIGYQIAGDNDDWRNLMTGTRYMNVDGMLPYENEITHYIKRTKHHVKYRVSPIFLGNDKVARGVLMEAYSVEDNGIKMNVFCYNVQPRVSIDYSTGYSKLLN